MPYEILHVWFKGFAERRLKIFDEPANTYMGDYLCQINMIEGTFEPSLYAFVTKGFKCNRGLAEEKYLKNAQFTVPISIIYGDRDWMLRVDNGHSLALITEKKRQFPARAKEYSFHIVPNSDHNLHADNPLALANIIIDEYTTQKP